MEDHVAAAPGELTLRIDEALERFLDHRSIELPDAAPLIDELRRMLGAGGKRLRPAFCYWGFRAAGGPDGDPIVAISASLELLHTFALVHDDVMDAAATRRGVPTTVALHGAAVAILAGDLALVLADSLFSEAGFDPTVAIPARRVYDRMRQEVIAGQSLDVRLSGQDVVSEEAARRVAVLKSGRYSVADPLQIGATLAAAPPGWLEAFAAFGEPLGEAFQLRDDLLGTFGDPALTGKPIDSDAREGKRHLLFARTVAALRGDERSRFVARWGRGDDLTEGDVAELHGAISASGARASVESTIEELLDASLAALDAAPLKADAKDILRELARAAALRTV